MATLTDLVRNLGEALIRVAGKPEGAAALSAAHLGPLAKLIGGLPAADLVALIGGRGTVDSNIELVEQAASLVATAFPPAAITATEVEIGLEALRLLLDAAGVGRAPFKLHIAPGQNPIQSGARGHI